MSTITIWKYTQPILTQFMKNDLRQRLLYFPPFQHPWTLLLLRYHSCFVQQLPIDSLKTTQKRGQDNNKHAGTTAMARKEFHSHFQSTNRSPWSVLLTILKE